MHKLTRKQADEWPYAASSAGVFRGLLKQKYPCWVAMGPARDLFTTEIADAIRGFLRNSLQESNSFVTFTLFMVGKTPQKTKPTIMIVSDDKPRRKEAYDKIKESKILGDYPGFEIGHCSVAAEHEDLCQLGSGDDASGHTSQYNEPKDPWQKSIALSHGLPLWSKPFRIHFQSSGHGKSPYATCGGAFTRNGQGYLITVAHVMGLSRSSDHPDHQTFGSVQDDSDDCEITGFEDWDSDAEDEIFNSMTSSGSQTSSSVGSDCEEWLLDRVPSHQLLPSAASTPPKGALVQRTDHGMSRNHQKRQKQSGNVNPEPIAIKTSIPPSPSWSPPAITENLSYSVFESPDGHPIGWKILGPAAMETTYNPMPRSYQAPNTWAPSSETKERPADPAASENLGPVVFIDRESDLVLVKVLRTTPGAKELQQNIGKVKPLDPQCYRNQDFWDQNASPITVLTISKGPITGKPSSMPFYTRLPGTRGFQKLHCFYLDEPLSPGDSGSWVVAGDNQELVGFVVAGSPKTGTCLVSPARRAMEVFDSLLQRRLDDSQSSLAKESGVSGPPKSTYNAKYETVHQGDLQPVTREHGPPSRLAQLGYAHVVDDDGVQREVPEGAMHTLPQSNIQIQKSKQRVVTDAQLGLTAEEVQLLRYHQVQAGLSSTSRAASNASSQDQLLLDESSVVALLKNLSGLMVQIQQRIKYLSEQSSMVTMQQYDRAGNLIETPDENIERFHDMMRQVDQLELEFDRIRRILETMKRFREEVDRINGQPPGLYGSQRVPDAKAGAETHRGKGSGRAQQGDEGNTAR